MDNKKFWSDLISEIKNMSDDEFLSAVDELGGFSQFEEKSCFSNDEILLKKFSTVPNEKLRPNYFENSLELCSENVRFKIEESLISKQLTFFVRTELCLEEAS